MKKLFFLLLLFPFFVFANGYGIATLVKGSVQVMTSDGKNKILKRGDKVFESDTIVTASKSVVRVVMVDTNIIDVYPNSKVFIKQYVYSPHEDIKNVRLEVAAGQIKSTVKQKYDNEKNKYNVKTPAIVAGVRGTIFTTEHELKTGVSHVFTHEGNVIVGRLDAQENVKDFFSVKANQKIQIDKTIEKPQVVEILNEEVQKQKNLDKEDGFIKVERNSREYRSDSSMPSGAFTPPGSSHSVGGNHNSNEPPTQPNRRESGDSKEGSSSEEREPPRSESRDSRENNEGEPPKRDETPAKREDSDSRKREDVPPIKLPERENNRPDSEESKKETKKRLEEELKRQKRSGKER